MFFQKSKSNIYPRFFSYPRGWWCSLIHGMANGGREFQIINCFVGSVDVSIAGKVFVAFCRVYVVVCRVSAGFGRVSLACKVFATTCRVYATAYIVSTISCRVFVVSCIVSATTCRVYVASCRVSTTFCSVLQEVRNFL